MKKIWEAILISSTACICLSLVGAVKSIFLFILLLGVLVLLAIRGSQLLFKKENKLNHKKCNDCKVMTKDRKIYKV